MLLLGTRAKDIVVDERDWPRCAKCHMPVEWFGVSDTSDSLIFLARCHGDEQVVEMPDEIWDSVIGTGVPTLGPAFAEENYDDTENGF